MVNKKNVLKVADAIENATLVKRGIGFNMAYFAETPTAKYPDHIDGCGTICCIAGHAFALKHPRMSARKIRNIEADIHGEAQVWLGLNHNQTSELFYHVPEDPGPSWDFETRRSSITPQEAVRTLRRLAETGRVDWSEAGKP